ncbi:hypothetical protein BLAT2472_30504 [Burkholderia latens]
MRYPSQESEYFFTLLIKISNEPDKFDVAFMLSGCRRDRRSRSYQTRSIRFYEIYFLTKDF